MNLHIIKAVFCFYDTEDSLNIPATAWAPQSLNGGKTISRWVPICDHEKDNWFDPTDWVGEFLPITKTPAESQGSTPDSAG